MPRGERLFDIGPSSIKDDAFVGESDAGRIMTDQAAKFVASLPGMGALQCRIAAVDRANLAALDQRAIASPYGGPVPAQPRSE